MLDICIQKIRCGNYALLNVLKKIAILNVVLYRCSLQGFSFTCVWEMAFIRYFKLLFFFSMCWGACFMRKPRTAIGAIFSQLPAYQYVEREREREKKRKVMTE